MRARTLTLLLLALAACNEVSPPAGQCDDSHPCAPEHTCIVGGVCAAGCSQLDDGGACPAGSTCTGSGPYCAEGKLCPAIAVLVCLYPDGGAP